MSKKWIVIILFSILLHMGLPVLYAQEKSGEDFIPLSEEFLYYREHPEEFVSGYIPPPNRLKLKDEEKEKGNVLKNSLPSYFHLKDHNRVTAVKNQGDRHWCWVFASIAALESHLMPKIYDLSENHLANHSGYYKANEKGGNMQMSLAYFVSGRGPVEEAQDPYGSPSLTRKLPTPVHVRTAYQVTKSEIKEMVYRYGAVETTIWGARPYSEYYNEETAAQYVPRDLMENHEVAVVGWDDHFSRDNFLIRPSKDGAWIVKNSWGEEFGKDGYYYVSYEDRTIGAENLVYVDSKESGWYDHIYQHDEYGGFLVLSGYYLPEDEYWFANVFTVESPEEALTAVSFYGMDKDVAYEVWMTDDYKGSFDVRKKLISGRLSHAGYHTIDLENPVPVRGKQFAVLVKMQKKENQWVRYEKNLEGSLYEAKSNPGESFVSGDGKWWDDVSEEGKNVCLKAFTMDMKGIILPDSPEEPQELREAQIYHQDLATSDLMKTWTIRFNQELYPDAAEVKIYEDGSFRQIPVRVEVTGSFVKIIPREFYQRGKGYYIYIGGLESTKGKRLRSPIKAKFTVN